MFRKKWKCIHCGYKQKSKKKDKKICKICNRDQTINIVELPVVIIFKSLQLYEETSNGKEIKNIREYFINPIRMQLQLRFGKTLGQILCNIICDHAFGNLFTGNGNTSNHMEIFKNGQYSIHRLLRLIKNNSLTTNGSLSEYKFLQLRVDQICKDIQKFVEQTYTFQDDNQLTNKVSFMFKNCILTIQDFNKFIFKDILNSQLNMTQINEFYDLLLQYTILLNDYAQLSNTYYYDIFKTLVLKDEIQDF